MVTRAGPVPSNPPIQWWLGHCLTPWACQGAYTRKCLHRRRLRRGGGRGQAYLLYGVDHAEGLDPEVSIGILRRLGPDDLEAPAGSSLGEENQPDGKIEVVLTVLKVSSLRPVPDHRMALLVPPLANPTVFRLLLLLRLRLGKVGDSCA